MRRGRFVLQTATLALCSGCACGALSSECFRTVPDAGALPRQIDEPCDAICVGELACTSNSVASNIYFAECLAPCDDAGMCSSGHACVAAGGWAACHRTCARSSDCTGRFAFECFDAGTTGVCMPRACGNGAPPDCPSGFQCAARPYCCPSGAPCPPPQPGVCVP